MDVPSVSLLLSLVVSLPLQTGSPAVGEGGRPILEISGAGFQALPLAVPDVKVVKGGVPVAPAGSPLAETDATAAAADELTKVLREDLAISAVFKVLDPAGYLPDAQKEGLVLGSFNVADWQAIGATGLLKTGLSRDGDKSRLEVHLFDVATAKELLNLKLDGPRDAERRLAQRAVDEVYRHYTKEPGVFRTRIAMVRQLKGKKDVFIADVDGRGGHALNLPDGLNLLPTWDADGRGVFFTSYAAGSPDLYRADLNSGAIQRISGRPGLNSGAAVSPDGKSVALTLSKDGNSEIYLLDRSGTEVRRLTNTPQIDSSPCWSPDGKQIAFVSARGGSPQIYVMDAAVGDKSARRVTFQGTYNQTPAWSPKGDKIAFTARDERNVFDIFTVDVKTNKIERLTQDQGNNEEPTWAPNGRLIAFTSDRTGTSALYVMPPDGAVQRLVSKDKGNFSTPAWGPLPPE